MFYFSDDNGSTFEERVGGAIVAAGMRKLDVDLPNVCAQVPEMILQYSYESQSWMSLTCQAVSNPAGIQRDWGDDNPYKRWRGCGTAVDDSLVWWEYDPETSEINSLMLLTFVGSPVSCLIPDTTSAHLYVAGENMFHRHASNGYPPESWVHIPVDEDADVRAIDIRPDDSYTILIANLGIGAYRSTDRGNNWVAINNGLSNQDAYCIKYCPWQTDIALIGTASGLFKSANVNSATPTWSAANYGASTDTVVAIDFHADNSSIVLRSEKDDGVGTTYISADTARSWIEMNTGLDGLIIHDIASDIDYSDTFYVATDSGVYKLENPVKSGTISAPGESWGPGLVIVNGDVTVESGATLSIEAGTEVLFVYDFDIVQGGSNSGKSELIVNGKLKALGNEDEPIVFMSSKPTGAGAGDWYGIRAMSGSVDSLAYCVIKHGDYGIKAASPSVLVVEHCTIEDNYSAGIHMTSPPSSTKIRYSNISDCGNFGIYASGNEFLAHSDTISGNRYGIHYKGDASPTIDNCLITYRSSPVSSYYGIYAVSPSGTAEVTVNADSIHGFDQGGIYFWKIGSDGIITKTDVVSCGVYGIKYEYSYADILGGGTSALDKNHIEGNTYGLHMSGSGTPDVRRTKFKNNTSYGAYITSACLPDFGTTTDKGENSFIREGPYVTYYDLYKEGIIYVWAQKNWWEEAPPTPAEIRGATYDPWLVSDPLPKIAPDWERLITAKDFELARAYPNPFNPTTMVSFNLSSPQFVTVKVFNIMGQEVKTVFEGYGSAGENTVIWDGKNDQGIPVSAGVYLVQMRTADRQKTIKATVLK